MTTLNSRSCYSFHFICLFLFFYLGFQKFSRDFAGAAAAAQLIESVIDKYTGDIGAEYDGLIHHVTHAKPQGQGFDECAVYGDFFYIEALARYLNPDFKKYW